MGMRVDGWVGGGGVVCDGMRRVELGRSRDGAARSDGFGFGGEGWVVVMVVVRSSPLFGGVIWGLVIRGGPGV